MATHEDAMLVMEIMRWAQETGATDTTHRLMREHRLGGDPPSTDDPDVVQVLVLHETVGTFVKQGVLDAGLVHDLMAVDWVWSVVGPGAIAMREEMGEPRLWENFEALATG